jgi:hypothetical protein
MIHGNYLEEKGILISGYFSERYRVYGRAARPGLLCFVVNVEWRNSPAFLFAGA